MHTPFKTLATVAALLMAGSFTAQAAVPPADQMPQVDARQARQHARIAAGAASGALTHHELRRLHREQHAVAHAERRAEADGTVTWRERRHLDRLQDRASRDIRRQKHDAQTTAPRG